MNITIFYLKNVKMLYEVLIEFDQRKIKFKNIESTVVPISFNSGRHGCDFPHL